MVKLRFPLKDLCYCMPQLRKWSSTVGNLEWAAPKFETPTDLATNEELKGICSPVLPTLNLAAYVNTSPTLKRLVDLGVDIDKIQRRKGLGKFILQLEFEKDIQDKLLFLKDVGVPDTRLGDWITKNPLIFREDVEVLKTRVDYLTVRNFKDKERERIITENPYWLMFAPRRLERRLGYMQREYGFLAAQVRELAVKQPRLITYNMQHLREATFCLREEMGFNASELQQIILKKPRLLMMNHTNLVERFTFIHQKMNLSHELLVQYPELLATRTFRLRNRHDFLNFLGRAQYDPKKIKYVSPADLIRGDEAYFCRYTAKVTLETYELFLHGRDTK